MTQFNEKSESIGESIFGHAGFDLATIAALTRRLQIATGSDMVELTQDDYDQIAIKGCSLKEGTNHETKAFVLKFVPSSQSSQ